MFRRQIITLQLSAASTYYSTSSSAASTGKATKINTASAELDTRQKSLNFNYKSYATGAQLSDPKMKDKELVMNVLFNIGGPNTFKSTLLNFKRFRESFDQFCKNDGADGSSALKMELFKKTVGSSTNKPMMMNDDGESSFSSTRRRRSSNNDEVEKMKIERMKSAASEHEEFVNSAVFELHHLKNQNAINTNNNNNKQNSSSVVSLQDVQQKIVPEVECGVGSSPPDGHAFRQFKLNPERRDRIINHLMRKGIIKRLSHSYWDEVTLRTYWADAIISEYDVVPSPSFSSSLSSASSQTNTNTFKLSKVFFKHDLGLSLGAGLEGQHSLASYEFFSAFRRQQMLFAGYLPDYVNKLSSSERRSFDRRRNEYFQQMLISDFRLGQTAKRVKRAMMIEVLKREDGRLLQNNEISNGTVNKNSTSSQEESLTSDSGDNLVRRGGGKKSNFSLGYQEMERRKQLKDKLTEAGIFKSQDQQFIDESRSQSERRQNINRVKMNTLRQQKKQFYLPENSSLISGMQNNRPTTSATSLLSSSLSTSTVVQRYQPHQTATGATTRADNRSSNHNHSNSDHKDDIKRKELITLVSAKSLGFKCRFKGEVTLYDARSKKQNNNNNSNTNSIIIDNVLQPMPYTKMTYRMRRIFHCPEYGVQIHVTSLKQMSNEHQSAIGHLGDGVIVLGRIPFENNNAVVTSTLATKTHHQNQKRGTRGGGSGDGYESNTSSSHEDTSNNNSASLSSLSWRGHSNLSTIEIEMIDPLKGDPRVRLEKFLTAANAVVEGGWPTSL